MVVEINNFLCWSIPKKLLLVKRNKHIPSGTEIINRPFAGFGVKSISFICNGAGTQMFQRSRRWRVIGSRFERDESSFRALLLFTSVNSAFVCVTKYFSIVSGPSRAHNSRSFCLAMLGVSVLCTLLTSAAWRENRDLKRPRRV